MDEEDRRRTCGTCPWVQNSVWAGGLPDAPPERLLRALSLASVPVEFLDPAHLTLRDMMDLQTVHQYTGRSIL